MPRAPRLTAGFAALVLGVLLTPAPASGAEPAPVPDARYFITPPPSSKELGSQVDRQQELLDRQQKQLDAATGKANAALETHQLATRQA